MRQARLLEETAYDLDALAFADREVRDEGGRLERQAVLRRHACDPLAERREVEPAGRRKRDVLRYRQRLEQREVLEHHADPEAPGGRGVGDGDRLATPAELAGGGLERAVHDLDQGRLASPVLAEQGMDPPRAEPHGHPVVRGELAETLHDLDRFEEESALRGRASGAPGGRPSLRGPSAVPPGDEAGDGAGPGAGPVTGPFTDRGAPGAGRRSRSRWPLAASSEWPECRPGTRDPRCAPPGCLPCGDGS